MSWQTCDDLDEAVWQGRVEQGLPGRVEDPAVLADVAAILLAGSEGGSGSDE